MEGVCEDCQTAFRETIAVVVDSQEELDALRQAVRQERRKGSLRPTEKTLGANGRLDQSAIVQQVLRKKNTPYFFVEHRYFSET